MKGSFFGPAGLKVIGGLKLVSGLLAVMVALGAGRFLHDGSYEHLERAVSHLGLDPHNVVIHTLISKITGIDRTHLRAVQAGTFCYALLHVIEAIGLFMGKDWAGYLVIVATSSLIPLELYELAKKFTALRVTFLILNIAIVIYLFMTLRTEHASQQRGATPKAT
jgi:uncharacterized membrane protein (DUF2068 family)